MSEEQKTVLELLEELKKETDWHPDEKVRETIVNRLIFAMIDN